MNFTIVIQGRIDLDCLKINLRQNQEIPIVISTWQDQNISELVSAIRSCNDTSKVKLVVSQFPKERGIQNFMLQLVSTINGLKFAESNFVIKVRGDEFFNYEVLMKKVEDNPDLIHTSPVFFRPFSNWAYHISDHLIAGRRDYLSEMFNGAKLRYESSMSHDDCKEWGLCMSHLRNMGFEEFHNHHKGKEEMRRRFGVIKMKDLSPYRVTANSYGRVFFDDFVPSHWQSIEDMEDL